MAKKGKAGKENGYGYIEHRRKELEADERRRKWYSYEERRGFLLRFCVWIPAGAGLIVLWSWLLGLVSGWLIALVNIGFVIITIFIIGLNALNFFVYYLRLPKPIAFILSTIIYIGLVIGIRSVF